MISLSSLERDINPFPLYQRMRQENPIYYDRERANWNVFRYKDVQQTLSQWQVYSSQFAGGQEAAGSSMPFAASMISSDPPRHRKLRSLVSQAFTPKSVEAMAPRINRIVEELIDEFSTGSPVDVVHGLATPLPVTVIAEMLGIPLKDRARFKSWSDEIVRFADLRGNFDSSGFISPAMLEMGQYFVAMIEKRRSQPEDDLISGLLAAEIDGERLDMIELIGFCALLLVAGNETTTNLISSAALTFAEQPELWQQLRTEPERLDAAIEEVLRYRSPVQSMFRITKEPVQVDGLTIPGGAPIVAWIGSANHDGDQFSEPDTFIVERSPNRHLAFGHGIHYCLGAPLARLESRAALRHLLERYQHLELAPGTQPERLPSMLVYGIKELPLVLTAA